MCLEVFYGINPKVRCHVSPSLTSFRVMLRCCTERLCACACVHACMGGYEFLLSLVHNLAIDLNSGPHSCGTCFEPEFHTATASVGNKPAS